MAMTENWFQNVYGKSKFWHLYFCVYIHTIFMKWQQSDRTEKHKKKGKIITFIVNWKIPTIKKYNLIFTLWEMSKTFVKSTFQSQIILPFISSHFTSKVIKKLTVCSTHEINVFYTYSRAIYNKIKQKQINLRCFNFISIKIIMCYLKWKDIALNNCPITCSNH